MIRIVTDTDANMPQSILDEFNITAVSIHIVFGDEVLRERVDISDADSYVRMSAAPELPKTSQPPVGDFLAAYQRILDEDPGATILSIHISGPLSGTIESARQAAALLPDADIRCFDTRSASLGQGLMVRQAAVMAREGASPEAIFAELERMRDGMQVYFVLNTLEYLAKGGRIGRASHLMGTLLDIKPVLILKDGIIDAHSRHRTWHRALAALREIVLSSPQARAGQQLQIGIVHAVSEAEAQRLADDLQAALNPGLLIIGEVGAGLGVHTGPGALGVAWYAPPESYT